MGIVASVVIAAFLSVPLAVPMIAGALGFTSAGVAAGSTAAGWMSSIATANGVGILSGSMFALLQSVGAAGLATGTSVLSAVGGSVAALFYALWWT